MFPFEKQSRRKAKRPSRPSDPRERFWEEEVAGASIHNHRLTKPAERLEDGLLVTCPECGKQILTGLRPRM